MCQAKTGPLLCAVSSLTVGTILDKEECGWACGLQGTMPQQEKKGQNQEEAQAICLWADDPISILTLSLGYIKF